MTGMGVVRQGFHAQQFQSQPVYAIENAVELRLVDDLPREESISVFRLYLHPLEGHGVPTVELASYHYAVDRPSASAHHLFTAAFHCFSVSERSARRDGRHHL